MRFNFGKIATAAASMAMVGSTVGLALAASYPAPFAEDGVGDVAVVYGSNLDLPAVSDITSSLNTHITSTGSTGVPEGGDFVQLDKSSDHINLGDALNGPFGSTVDDDDLEVLLADGEYTADDSDTFSFEQKINLGGPALSHFRDSDYEEQQGIDDRTPVVGINISDGDYIFNYTLDFLDQAESDVVSGDFDDLEGSDLPLLGKLFYVSDWKNGTSTATTGKLTLLDSATRTTVAEGETVTVVVNGVSYQVSIDFIDSDSTVLTVNGEDTNDLAEGQTEKIAEDVFVGVTDVRRLEVSGELGSVEFSIGEGKLELTHGSDVKINDDSITDLKAFMYKGSANEGQSIDKIDIQWSAEDDSFITPDSEITLPGFGGVKFSMNDLVRNDEEVITFEKGGDKDAQLVVPVKDGDAEINLFFANASGELVGLGEGPGEWLATSRSNNLHFIEKWKSSDFHKWAVVSYNTTDIAESYLLSFDATEDTGDGRNETTIKNEITGDTWDNRVGGDTFDLGDVQFTITEVFVNATTKYVNITAGTDVNFKYVFTDGGLMFNLPTLARNATGLQGEVNYSDSAHAVAGNVDHIDVVDQLQGITTTSPTSNFTSDAGMGWDNWWLFAEGEDKDDNLFSGTMFNFTLDDTSSDNLQISQVENSGTGGPRGEEHEGIGNNVYETYIKDDVAPRILHYTDPDEDYVEIFYPTGDSETYAEIFLTAADATTGSSTAGGLSVMDSELSNSGMQTKNLILVGGTCVNSAAATVLNVPSPTCGDAWTAATGSGPGSWVVETFTNPWSNSKVATLVAGYEQGDTANAAEAFTTQDITTDVGQKYTGTTGTAATPVIN